VHASAGVAKRGGANHRLRFHDPARLLRSVKTTPA
jgi:hypothetical protein